MKTLNISKIILGLSVLLFANSGFAQDKMMTKSTKMLGGQRCMLLKT